MRSRKSNQGYVLVMTLLLLALAGTVMTKVAMESRREALFALAAQEDMQLRWGVITCQQTLLPHAGEAMKFANSRLKHPSRFANAHIELGGRQFGLRFANEQAKVSVNMLAKRLKGSDLIGAIHRVVDASTPIHLSPGEGPSPFVSYGQVFGNVSAPSLFGIKNKRGFSDMLTCWGDGRLSTESASPETITQVAALVLPQVQLEKFKAAQIHAPDQSWTDLFTSLKFAPEQLAAMQQLTIPASQCYSLWIVANANARPTYHFAVESTSGDAYTFEW